MKILLYSDLIISYLDDETPITQKREIAKILNNENSKILYSKQYLDYLHQLIGDEDDVFLQFRKDLMNNNGEEITTITSTNFDAEFANIYSTDKSNVLITIAFFTPNHTITTATNKKIAVLSEQQKPNYHWLVVQLAICHPFTLSVDEDDFKSDLEVDKLFENVFSIPKKIEGVIIFDDYCNSEHNKFNYLKTNKIKVFYYTCVGNPAEYRQKYSNLAKVLSNKNLFYNNKGHAHTRKILFEGFIVNPDIDFKILNKSDNKVWSVHIRFSKIKYNIALKLRDEYTKFIP